MANKMTNEQASKNGGLARFFPNYHCLLNISSRYITLFSDFSRKNHREGSSR